jgi:hypothetical protein
MTKARLLEMIVEHFLASDSDSSHLEVERLGGDAEALYRALLLVVRHLGVDDQVKVSLRGEGTEVHLDRLSPKSKPSWASGVVDKFLADIDAGNTDHLEITLKDDVYKAEDLAAELEQEIGNRGLANVIEVSSWERRVDLTYLEGNLDVLFAADLEKVDSEKVLVQDFLDSGEPTRRLELGGGRIENRRRLGRVAAAAAELGVMRPLGLSCDATSITLTRTD